jgi:hypothetical protein
MSSDARNFDSAAISISSGGDSGGNSQSYDTTFSADRESFTEAGAGTRLTVK